MVNGQNGQLIGLWACFYGFVLGFLGFLGFLVVSDSWSHFKVSSDKDILAIQEQLMGSTRVIEFYSGFWLSLQY